MMWIANAASQVARQGHDPVPSCLKATLKILQHLWRDERLQGEFQ